MKQIYFLVIAIMLGVMPAKAADITVDGLTYEIISNTVYEGKYQHVRLIAADANLSGDIVIPEIPAVYAGGVLYFRVTEIGKMAFMESGLNSIAIPASVTHLGSYAFENCRSLKNISTFWTNPANTLFDYSDYDGSLISPFTYGADLSTINLHVPPGTKAACQAADVWKDFNIVDDATGIDKITNYELKITVVNGELRIINDTLKGNETIQIFDIAGKIIHNSSFIINNSINVSHLPSGVYFVKVNNGQGVKWVKK